MNKMESYPKLNAEINNLVRDLENNGLVSFSQEPQA